MALHPKDNIDWMDLSIKKEDVDSPELNTASIQR